jgi:hypothetical protein
VHQLTPYVSCAIVGRRVVDAGTVIRNGNFDGANPLRDLCALCVTVRGMASSESCAKAREKVRTITRSAAIFIGVPAPCGLRQQR